MLTRPDGHDAHNALAGREGAQSGRRTRCERCLRPVSHCLCAHIPSLPSQTRILVLQHPDEARHPLNTARLAVLGLHNAELLVGEEFPGLEERLMKADEAWLLFPTKDGQSSAPLSPYDGAGSPLLIVPDGTWRKARKIVQANPVLGQLPHLSLPPGAPSEYRVRKARETGAVSTVEAIVRVLSVLEPQKDFQPLLKPFEVLVEQQVSAMGEETYLRNHSR